MLLILASVATYTGIESYDKAEQIKFVSQMKLIQTKVDEKVQEDGTTKEMTAYELSASKFSIAKEEEKEENTEEV